MDTITLESELAVSKSLTINGYNNATSNNITVQVEAPGTSAYRVFDIDADGETVNISNMAINGGDISELSDAGRLRWWNLREGRDCYA